MSGPISLILLAGACFVSPAMLVVLGLRRAGPEVRLASVGPAAMLLNTLVPLVLHLTAVPISASTLADVHVAVFALLAGGVIWVARQRPFHALDSVAFAWQSVGPLVLLYALLVLPVTFVAGIDTYKWQDLATAVAVEQRIPWYIHPLSLLGFTPRAYPSAQPLVLASVQILGGIGVDWGFYVVSVLTGFTALTGAYALGRRLFPGAAAAWWLALLYGFSPLLMRYGYWATGRGFLLALLPLFIRCLLDARKPAWALSSLLTAAMLVLSHKAGLVAAFLIPLAMALSPFLTWVGNRKAWPAILGAGAAIVGVLFLAGGVSGVVRLATRFGAVVVLAIPGWLNTGGTREWRVLLAATLVTLPLASADDPYGALIAAPFVACAATNGVEVLFRRFPSVDPLGLRAVVVTLVLVCALAVLVRQGIDSPSRAVVKAALFLEARDPLGPYRIEAPGATRTRMQAYVSGCPRFRVETSADARLTLGAPPPPSGRLKEDLHRWTSWLRGALQLSDAASDWYGTGPRVYYVRVNGEGAAPAGAVPIYSEDGVTILTSP